MRKAPRRPRDLFDEAPPLTELRPDLRTRLAPLLQVLLTEAAGWQQRQAESKDRDGEEAGDDQDHT